MTISAPDNDSTAIFQRSKVATVEGLTARLQCSLPTVRRRLKKWHAYTSYNKNGRYYTIPQIPEFDRYGLWKYGNIFFSRYGTLKNTINALIHQSTAGLSAFDLDDLVGVSTHSSLSQFKDNASFYREKHRGIYIYFSSQCDISEQQKCAREKLNQLAAKHELPSDKHAVVILAEFIKEPTHKYITAVESMCYGRVQQN